MIAADEDALICDFAETYHVFDWRGLPVSTAAVLAWGLGEDSRIKMAIMGARVSLNTQLLARLTDDLNLLVWAKSRDGQRGVNRPKSILEFLTGAGDARSEVQAFRSAEEFERAWERLRKEEVSDYGN